MAATQPLVHAAIRIDLDKLEGAGEAATDLRPVWLRDMQPYVTDFLHRRFNSEGAYMGSKWAPHAPATVELRKQPGRGRGGIGRDVNRMWASLVKSAGSSPAPGGVLVIEPQRYERGTTVKHAQWFAGGYRSTHKPLRITDPNGKPVWIFVRRVVPKRVPARPIFPNPLPRDVEKFAADAIRRHVVADAQGGGAA